MRNGETQKSVKGQVWETANGDNVLVITGNPLMVIPVEICDIKKDKDGRREYNNNNLESFSTRYSINDFKEAIVNCSLLKSYKEDDLKEYKYCINNNTILYVDNIIGGMLQQPIIETNENQPNFMPSPYPPVRYSPRYNSRAEGRINSGF